VKSFDEFIKHSPEKRDFLSIATRKPATFHFACAVLFKYVEHQLSRPSAIADASPSPRNIIYHASGFFFLFLIFFSAVSLRNEKKNE